MESDDVREHLRHAERGEAAAWLTYSTHEWWQPLLFGAWAGAFVLGQSLAGGTSRLLSLVLALLPLLYILWDRRRRPVYPIGSMPREMRRSTWVLAALSAVIIGLTWSTYTAASPGVGAVVAAVSTAVALELYGRVYDADAARVRARLG